MIPQGGVISPNAKRHDHHHAHMHGVDVAEFLQRQDHRHQDDDRRQSVEEVADDQEQHGDEEQDGAGIGGAHRAAPSP